MPITKRITKGSALTFQELDANFTHVEGLLPSFAGQQSHSGTWTGSTGITATKPSTGNYKLQFPSAFSAATDYHVQVSIQDGSNDQRHIEVTRSTAFCTIEVYADTNGNGDADTLADLPSGAHLSVLIYTNTTTTGGGPRIETLAGLNDVTITSPQNEQIIKYNGSAFVNAFSSVSNVFTGLTDTPSSFGTSGQFLAVNSAGNGLEFVSNSTSGIFLADDQQARIGADADLTIFHESSSNNSIIRESGSGDLLIQGNNLKLQNADGTEDYLVATSNGSVAIKHDNATKLETTSSGINVTGLVEFDTLKGTGLGAVTINNILDQDDMASDSATSLATQQSIKAYIDNELTEGIIVAGTTNEIDVSESSGTFTVGLVDNVVVGGSLTVDSVKIDGATIGHTSDLDLLTLADGVLTVAGELESTTLDVNGAASIAGAVTDVTTLTASGAITGGSFVIGSADISEAELETIDGVTAGTVSASKAVVVDANKDVTGFRNVTVAGNLTVNGTTTTVATTNTTVSDKLLELGTGTTGSASGDAGIVIERGDDANAFIGFDEDADKFIVGTGTFTGASTGDLTITTGTLVSNLEGNVTGALTGNADTATTLATARDIGGVSFNGSASINLPGVNTAGNQDTSGNAGTATTLATARNIGGVSFNGSASIDLPGVNTAGNQNTSGTAAKATVTDSTANTNFPVVFNNESDGLLDDTGTFIYNPSTGLVSATGFSGALTGTLQTAAQTNVTSVGTLNAGAISSGFGNIDVGSSTITSGQITSNATKFELTDTTTGSTTEGPVIELFRNGGNGDNQDLLGALKFFGNDSGGTKTEFAEMVVESFTASNGSETGKVTFNIMAAGLQRSSFEILSDGTAQLNDYTAGTNAGPLLYLTRDRTGQDDQELGKILFQGEDDGNGITNYATVYAKIIDASNTTEDGSLNFTVMTAGSETDPLLTLAGAGSTLTSSLTLGATSATVGGKILFKEGTNGGTNAVSLIGPATTADVDILLPNVAGTIVLKDSTDTLTNKSIDAGQLTGTIDNARLPAAATNITSVGTLTALTVDNIAINGTTIGHTSDTDILTFANAEPRLTVNASAMEIVDTNAGDNPGPTLSLYRNSSSPANSDEIGRILFLGENDANEKTYYAQIATEISSSGFDDGGEAASIRFYVTDGGSGTDNTVTDLTEDQFDIGPSDTTALTLTSAGATIGGSVGLMLGSSGQGIRFEGSNLGEGDSAYENFLRQQEPTQASVNSGDNHSYQMLPRGSGVLLRSRGSSQIDDANVDKSADTVTFSSAHGLRTGDQVVYNDAYSTSLEVSNVDADSQTFFAIVTSTTAIKLASTLANALAGTALDIDDDGADNQSFLFPHQMDNPIQMRDQVFEVGHKTTSERDALAAPTKFNGALIYNDDTESLNAYVGGNAWGDVEVGVLASNAIITGTSIAHGVFTTYRGKKVVFTGSGNCTVQLPNVQGGTSDIGATWTICNAGSANVILDLNGSGTTQTLKILTGASVATASADPHIAPGGVASLICIQGSTVTVSNYILFGSGVVDNS